MRPPRADIAIPPFPPGTEWTGETPRDSERLAAKGPVLIHFLDAAQLNCARSIPYVLEWHRRYEPHGLTVAGIHTARFGFTEDAGNVRACVSSLGITHPVAIDAERRAWRDYGCQGWPSLFLFSKGGALRWYHLGEGEYRETELAIQEELIAAAEDDPPELPDPADPIRPSDAPGAKVMPPTGELFPGGSPELSWRASDADPAIEVDYAAGGVAASVSGSGEIEVSLDGEPHEPVQVTGPGLIEIASHAHHEEHRLELRPSAGVEVWSVSFAPGTPG